MSYCIYGFRLKGDLECRYVGLTAYTPESRLLSLTRLARLNGRRPTEGFDGWLLDNEGFIEAVPLASAPDKNEAHAKEREVVGICLALSHRLFNSWLVPADQRRNWRPSRFHQRRAA